MSNPEWFTAHLNSARNTFSHEFALSVFGHHLDFLAIFSDDLPADATVTKILHPLWGELFERPVSKCVAVDRWMGLGSNEI